MNYRNDQITGRQCYCHSNIDISVFNNIISIHRYIYHREVLNGLHNSFHNNRSEGHLFTFAGFKLFLYLIAPVNNCSHIGFHKRSYVWRNSLGVNHAACNHFAHTIHFNDFIVCANRNLHFRLCNRSRS